MTALPGLHAAKPIATPSTQREEPTKVMAAAAALDAAWEAGAAKAELRAKAKVLEAQLAEIKAQIKGAPVQAEPAEKVDYKAVRAWAEDNGWSVPKVGRIGRDIVDAYNEAQGR